MKFDAPVLVGLDAPKLKLDAVVGFGLDAPKLKVDAAVVVGFEPPKPYVDGGAVVGFDAPKSKVDAVTGILLTAEVVTVKFVEPPNTEPFVIWGAPPPKLKPEVVAVVTTRVPKTFVCVAAGKAGVTPPDPDMAWF